MSRAAQVCVHGDTQLFLIIWSEMNCCLHCRWQIFVRLSPSEPASGLLPDDSTSVVHSRKKKSQGIGRWRFCESILYLRYRFLDAGTSVFILMTHLRTGCCVFIQILHILRNRFPDAWTIWILILHSVIHRAVRYTPIQRRRPIHAPWYQRIVDFDFATTGSSNWSEMGARKHRKIHDVEHLEKMIPFITCEVAFRLSM